MINARIAEIFEEMADLLELQSANPFRVRAYRNAARTIHGLTESIEAVVADSNRTLTDIPSIGKDLAEKISTILATGDLPQRQELAAKMPASVLTLLRVPGLGPKKAAVLFNELKVTTIEELREACEQHRVRDLKGFGDKTEQTIMQGLELASQSQVRLLWADVEPYAQAIAEVLRACDSVKKCEAAGSYRRGKETVGDLDFLVVAEKPDEPMDRLGSFPEVREVIARGDTKMSVRLANRLQVDLRVVPEESFGAALQYFTGSKEHNVVVRGMAKQLGLKINEYGVYRGDEYVAGRTEEEVYKSVGLPWFPPEMREARQEFEWARRGKLPKLIEQSDVQGDLHVHTTETDGRATLEEMVEAARKRGLKYIAITDHSKRVSMANGLDGVRLRKQWREIDELNRKLDGFTVLKGVEVDILEKGPLDLPDDVLREADWVVASVHYGQNQPAAQITKRIVDALRNPWVCAIAHPTGRLINRRNAYEVDLNAVIREAKAHHKILELNSSPSRLDLDDINCAAAKAEGVPIVISTDAHHPDGLDDLRYGILQARRAGLTAADVINTLPLDELKRRLHRGAST